MTAAIANSAFIPGTKQQFAWDSTSIGALKKCPYYYQLTIVDGYQSQLDNVHLTFGIAYHSATERYDHARAKGDNHEAALRIAIRHALAITWNSETNRPWISEDKNKNRLTLIRTLVWYLDKFQDDKLETVLLANGKPAVELSFRLEMDFGPATAPGQMYMLCGHLDRIATLEGQTFIVDKKTTRHTLDDNYFRGYTPDNQFSTYSFAGRIIYPGPIHGLIVDAAQIAVTFSRFQRGLVSRTAEQLDEWYADLQVKLRENEQYVANNYWPRNDKACFMCEFREICSKSPSQREAWLKNKFRKRVWNPLQTRGDV